MATSPEPAPPTTGPPAEPEDKPSRLGRIAATVILLSIVALWAYALSPLASRRPPGTLDNDGFPKQAEVICQTTAQTVSGLPQAFEAATPGERADVIDRVDTELTAMVAHLRAVAPGTDSRDGGMINEWLDDWGVLIGDRSDYATRLREDPDARFLVTPKDGRQITEAIDRFARINKMDSCATPEDVS